MYTYMFLYCVESLIGFFTNFYNCSKIGTKDHVQRILSKMAKREFYIFFWIHIHVLMLCRKFELIPIKIGFLHIFKLLKNLAKVNM